MMGFVKDLSGIRERARHNAKGVYPAHRSQKRCALGPERDLLNGICEGCVWRNGICQSPTA